MMNRILIFALSFLIVSVNNLVISQEQLKVIHAFYGENRVDFLGTGLAGGDFNDDGYCDVLIGSGAWKKGNFTGKNYLYFGSSFMDDIVDITFTGDQREEYFDYVTSTGDLNNDGFADIIIPAPGYPDKKGKVKIYHSGTNLDTIPEMVLNGKIERKGLGFSVSVDGDVNGDGYSDLLIRALKTSPEDPYNVFIYHGGTSMDSIADWGLYGGKYLTEVVYAGDVNGDGYNDVLISAENKPTKLYYGAAEMDTIPDLTFYEGFTMAGIGDLNADGFDDIAINYAKGGPEGTYLFYGSAAMDTIPDLIFKKLQDKPVHAKTISGGDINGDGYPDVILGQVIRFGTGAVYVYAGGPNMDNLPEVAMYGSNFGKGFGTYISGVGDVDGDGDDELLVGDTEYLDKGRVFLFAGDKNLPITGVAAVDMEEMPVDFVLLQNYPNPFNMSTRLQYEFNSVTSQWVRLSIFNLIGKEVIRLVDNKQSSGQYEVNWDGTDRYGNGVSSGVYCCQLKVGSQTTSHKIIVLR